MMLIADTVCIYFLKVLIIKGQTYSLIDYFNTFVSLRPALLIDLSDFPKFDFIHVNSVKKIE